MKSALQKQLVQAAPVQRVTVSANYQLSLVRNHVQYSLAQVDCFLSHETICAAEVCAEGACLSAGGCGARPCGIICMMTLLAPSVTKLIQQL